MDKFPTTFRPFRKFWSFRSILAEIIISLALFSSWRLGLLGLLTLRGRVLWFMSFVYLTAPYVSSSEKIVTEDTTSMTDASISAATLDRNLREVTDKYSMKEATTKAVLQMKF